MAHPKNLFDIIVRPNWEPHIVDVSDEDDVKSANDDFSAGRDASIYGMLPNPLRFEVRAFGKIVHGDTDTFDDLAGAAQLVAQSGLSAEDKVEIWKAVVSEELGDDDSFWAVADELVEEALE